jgi:hypothetical protein
LAKELAHHAPPAAAAEENNDFSNRVATVAAIGIGAALIEAELIPGILIGIAAMLAPNLVPKLGTALRPLVKTVVRAGYTLVDKGREMAAETSEQLQDIVAEVKAEHEQATMTVGPESNSGHS